MDDQHEGPRKTGYALCCSARSGSNYLCALLRSTNLLGRPGEHFSRSGGPKDRPHSLDARIDWILDDRATPNGVYGLKVFAQHFDDAARTGWTERLPNLKFVRLMRQDILGQAISASRAFQTNRWRAAVTAERDAQYSKAQILTNLARIAEEEARWRMFFARNAISPLTLYYEEFVKDSQTAINQIAELMGVSDPVPIDWTAIQSKIMRDEHTDAWRARFLAETSGTERLDALSAKAQIARSLRRSVRRFFRR